MILSWLLAVLVLVIGAVFLNVLSSSLAGYEEFPLHFGFVSFVTVIGAVLFLFWGWTSTAWVLGVVAAWGIGSALWERRSGSKNILYHGMSPRGSQPSHQADYEND
jgi:hypothetical protein